MTLEPLPSGNAGSPKVSAPSQRRRSGHRRSPAAPTLPASSRTSRPRPSWAAIASAASARSGRAPGPPSMTSPSSPAGSRASRSKATANSAPRRTVLGTRYAAKPIELDIPVMITGMSFGALSYNAKVALARAHARRAGSTTTGDGGMLPAERENSRVLIYEVLPSRYGINVHHLRQADAIELTIGQGAKPGTGGLLLGSKVSAEIARMRDLPPGVDQRSPCRHPDFLGPRRHDHQDRGAARGHRLAGADLRQAGRQPGLRRRQAGGQGRGRRRRDRRHGRRHRRLARPAAGAHRHSDPGRGVRGPRRPGGTGPLRRGAA